MESPLLIALSRQIALRNQMDVIAHNVANMSTPGFKAQTMLFQEYLDQPAIRERLSFVQDYGTIRNLAEGPLQQTGNPLDLALQGGGYFVVDTVNGQRYTRNGTFMLDAERQIVTSGGLPVLDDNDQPITVPDDAVDIRMSANGVVSTEFGELATLKIVQFEREQFLQELGGGLYASEEPELPAENVQVVQGSIEGSNVQGVAEMARMIQVSRTYQSVQRLVDGEHERMRDMIRTLPRLPG